MNHHCSTAEFTKSTKVEYLETIISFAYSAGSAVKDLYGPFNSHFPLNHYASSLSILSPLIVLA